MKVTLGYTIHEQDPVNGWFAHGIDMAGTHYPSAVYSANAIAEKYGNPVRLTTDVNGDDVVVYQFYPAAALEELARA